MSAEQSNGRNKVNTKRLCLYGMFACLCLVFGFVERMFPMDFAAPGVRLGLANSVALCLLFYGDTKGAFAVNTARIVLSALLFGTAVSFCYSFCAGTLSLLFCTALKRCKSVSIIGVSLAGGAVHNIVQLAVATVFLSKSVLYYMPVLILLGGVCGVLTGIISLLILKKVKTNGIFCDILN